MAHICRKEVVNINYPWGSPDIGLSEQNFKSAILNMSKELKKIQRSKELKVS